MSDYFNSDTICAISTPQGNGAIAVVRLSGDKSLEIASKIFQPVGKDIPKHATMQFGTVFYNNEILDEVMLCWFQAPRSYTGEDVVEISCHGSIYIQQKLLESLVINGARLALPGEFTFRAYRNNKLDLAQSEAVADLIQSENKQSHDIAIKHLKGGYSSSIKELRDKMINLAALFELELDFSEEDVEFANRDEMFLLLNTIEYELDSLIKSFELGNVLKNGIPVAIIGKPNVGKSTLLNILLNEEKAIVSDIPGTTRDAIEDVININGYLFRFIDTAGLRKATDTIEAIGIERTYEKINKAEIILHLIDLSNTDESEVFNELKEFSEHLEDKSKKWILIGNKADEVNELPKWFKKLVDLNTIFISAKRNENINLIIDHISDYVEQKKMTGATIVTNTRHYEAMLRALDSILSVKESFANNIPTDLVAIDLRNALYHLGSITEEVSSNDILGEIFGSFCIGK
ncbi:tRNA uridine-5-carboxymethylaminomethyl(34) synthesis GTPase MnmE [Bacteroidales bacterium OttesenSCG-928-K03]|nr:tRNA uridine-5-carboxymethylaminomethyl(34) synthesis GTPase MnmE [Bacteroidales bacterium OttesenSCG-928-L14]MDL2240341.1 tRNA uridine-5-carboxymethylaminomethyl(34) synthesis GTPase MnmE [Bacteroidales bacterium OttesenSCG-928-K22]MDL2242494.1 tRNA uridine-5-carboxymethylaminomethyl(34) synthesis GTPase MnmE [Bacteroidales bacterium OttesenSCG-928-K03]